MGKAGLRNATKRATAGMSVAVLDLTVMVTQTATVMQTEPIPSGSGLAVIGSAATPCREVRMEMVWRGAPDAGDASPPFGRDSDGSTGGHCPALVPGTMGRGDHGGRDQDQSQNEQEHAGDDFAHDLSSTLLVFRSLMLHLRNDELAVK